MQQYKEIKYVPIDQIKEHPDVPNVRASSEITKAEVQELMKSIAEKGVQNPLTVFRFDGKDEYFLVSGWRRKRAVEEIVKENPKSELRNVPVLVKEYNKETLVRDALFDNLIENIQRKDLNGWDKAMRLKMLLDNGMGKQEIMQNISKSITWINDTLKVLEADEEVKAKVKAGEITLDEAKKVAKLPHGSQATVAKGLAAAKKSGDKEAKKNIKHKLDEATREKSHVSPPKKEVKYNRNVLHEILIAMKVAKEDKSEIYYTLVGAYNAFEWILGEKPPMNLSKFLAKYELKVNKAGHKVEQKEKKARKKSSKK